MLHESYFKARGVLVNSLVLSDDGVLTLRDKNGVVVYTLDNNMMPALNSACRSELAVDSKYLGNCNNDTAVFINLANNVVIAPCLPKFKNQVPDYREVEVIADANTGSSIYRLVDTGLEYRSKTGIIKTDI
jgi:hypothetical protein